MVHVEVGMKVAVRADVIAKANQSYSYANLEKDFRFKTVLGHDSNIFGWHNDVQVITLDFEDEKAYMYFILRWG
jgi:hypothetical protein